MSHPRRTAMLAAVLAFAFTLGALPAAGLAGEEKGMVAVFDVPTMT